MVHTMQSHETRFATLLVSALIAFMFLLTGAGGCSSDPNVEGAKLDLRNRDYDRALENLEIALENDPDNVDALALKGTVLMEQAGTVQELEAHTELVDEAVENWNRALELASDGSTRNDIIQQQKLSWYREYERGMAAFNRGAEDKANFDRAATYFDNATRIQPDSATTHINLAYALISSGRSDEAIPALESAIEFGDRNPDTYNYLGELYLANGEAEKAISFLEEATQMFPDDANLRGRLFNAYISSGQVERGVNLAKAGVEEEPDNPVFRYNYGSLLLQAERFEEAIAELAKAAELDPDNSNAYYNLGAAYENWAVSLNDRIAELEEEMDAEGITEEQEQAIEGDINALAEERTTLFERAVQPLKRARQLVEERGDDPAEICNALFQAYAQVNEMELAQEAADCAGIDLGN